MSRSDRRHRAGSSGHPNGRVCDRCGYRGLSDRQQCRGGSDRQQYGGLSDRQQCCGGSDRRRGHRVPIWVALSAAVLIAVHAVPSQAQRAGGSGEGLQSCAGISNEADRLACYDRLARGANAPQRESGADAAAGAPPARPAPAAGERRSSAADEAAANDRAERGDRNRGNGGAAPASEAAPAARTEPRRAPAAEAAERAAVPPPAERAQPGVAPAEVERGVAPAQAETATANRPIRVVALRKNLSGLAIMTTESGEVWQQLAYVNRRFPSPPFDAELEPAANGSFFLLLGNGAPRIRVRRAD